MIKPPTSSTGCYLSNRIFTGYDEIINACCDAWRRLEAEAGRIQSIATRSWATIGQSQ